jgi:phage gpG-like protein
VGVRMSFDFYGDVQLDRTLERFAESVADATPAWEKMADRFVRVERRQFASEGAYGSGGWAPLSPRYAAWKAAHYPGKPILRRTDDLWRSLTTGPAIRVITPSMMIVGSDVAYGRYHQRGGPKLPRRRPVEFPEAERREWVKILQRFIVTGKV